MTKRSRPNTLFYTEKPQNDSVADFPHFLKNLKNITKPFEAKTNKVKSKSQNESYLLKRYFLPAQLQTARFLKTPFSQNQPRLNAWRQEDNQS